MALENRVESFCADLILEKPVVLLKVEEQRYSGGWISLMKEFNAVFEDLSKKSELVFRTTEEILQKLENELKIITKSNEESNTETESIENGTMDMQETCEKLKFNIEELKDKLKGMESGEKTYEDEMNEIKNSIIQMKKLLLKITRLHWDENKMKKNVLSGYVNNISGDDVSIFEMPMENASNKSDFLWDYISSGVSSNWSIKK